MSAPDELTITIGAKEIYDELKRVGGVIEDMREDRKEDLVARADHESRLRSLERWKYGLGGSSMASLIAAGVSLLTKRHGG